LFKFSALHRFELLLEVEYAEDPEIPNAFTVSKQLLLSSPAVIDFGITRALVWFRLKINLQL
jgi:hypothetical protein